MNIKKIILDHVKIIKLHNLSQHIKNNHKKVYDNIINNTVFLNEKSNTIKFSERLYCIINDINYIKKCECGKYLNFLNMKIGYSINCLKCSYKSTSRNIKIRNAILGTKSGITHNLKNILNSKNYTLIDESIFYDYIIKLTSKDIHYKLSRKFSNELYSLIYYTKDIDTVTSFPICERIYLFIYKKIPICRNCGKRVKKFRPNGIHSIFGKFCSHKCGKEMGYDTGYYDYLLPSKKIIRVQGYESKALNILFEKYNENDIIIGSKNIHKYLNKRFYYYDKNNIKHQYFPDLYIIPDKKIIEVKSEWTYNKKGTSDYWEEINNLKRNSVIKNNIKFEFMIL